MERAPAHLTDRARSGRFRVSWNMSESALWRVHCLAVVGCRWLSLHLLAGPCLSDLSASQRAMRAVLPRLEADAARQATSESWTPSWTSIPVSVPGRSYWGSLGMAWRTFPGPWSGSSAEGYSGYSRL